MPDVKQDQTLNPNAQPPNQTADSQTKTYVDDYQPPQGFGQASVSNQAGVATQDDTQALTHTQTESQTDATTNQSADSLSDSTTPSASPGLSVPEPEVSPADAEAALNQVLKQLNDDSTIKTQGSKAKGQDQTSVNHDLEGKGQKETKQVQVSETQESSAVAEPKLPTASKPQAASDLPTNSQLAHASTNMPPSNTSTPTRPTSKQVTDDEIAKAKQTLEEILAEIEAKRAQNSKLKGQSFKDKTQEQASVSSQEPELKSQTSATTDTRSNGQPTHQVSPSSAPSVPSVQPTTPLANNLVQPTKDQRPDDSLNRSQSSVSAEEAKKAREELMKILDELEAEKTQNEKLKGQSFKDKTQEQAPVSRQEEKAKSQASTNSQLLDFDAEDDLPVKVGDTQTQSAKLKTQNPKLQTKADLTATSPTTTFSATSANQSSTLTGQPSTPTINQPTKAQNTSKTGPSEKLEDQNIFFMLGVDDAKEEEKESFLDELQQVVWEDFLDNDAKLLLTQEEYQKLESMLQQQKNKGFANQTEIVAYLEKLIPDLEEIMVEKAVELKADMFKERLADLKQQHQADTDKLAKVSQAEQLMQQNQWYSAAKLLNQL